MGKAEGGMGKAGRAGRTFFLQRDKARAAPAPPGLAGQGALAGA